MCVDGIVNHAPDGARDIHRQRNAPINGTSYSRPAKKRTPVERQACESELCLIPDYSDQNILDGQGDTNP